MTLESGKIIRKRRGWWKRGGVRVTWVCSHPLPHPPNVFPAHISLQSGSPQSERLEHAIGLYGEQISKRQQQNICTIIKWKESQEGDINAQRNVNFIALWKRKENDEKKRFLHQGKIIGSKDLKYLEFQLVVLAHLLL